MAFQESGVKLSVSGYSAFIYQLNSASQAAASFGKGGGGSFAIDTKGLAAFSASANTSVGEVEARFGKLNSFTAGIFAGLGSTLASSLISGATAAASAIPNLLKTAFSEAISLEQAGANAFAISQPTQQQQADLAKLAESVALNPNLQVSQQGALEAIDAALKANIDASKLVNDGVIQAIVAQQNALGGSFEDNARLISKQLNDQIGEANPLTAQQLANQNVGTFRAGQFRSINDLLLAQAASGGSLKQLGLSQQQFNEFLAIAGTTASGGSDAGTSVKSFVNAATNASKEQRKAQQALGFNIADSTGQFNNALTLSQQLSEARINGINRIIESGGGTKEQQAELKRLNRLVNSNLNSASNLANGLTGVNLTDKQRAKRIEAANVQAQNAKAQFDALLSTVPSLQQTATKIKASETQFAGLLFQAFGTDGGRFAAALAGLSEEDAKRVTELITTADALQVAAIKTDTVSAKIEAIGDIFTANVAKIAKPSLVPLKDFLSTVATFGGQITPIFEFVGAKLSNALVKPLTFASGLIKNLGLNLGNFLSGFSNTIRLSDILQIDPGKFDIAFTRDIFGNVGLTSLKFGDFFTFDNKAGLIDVDIANVVHFTSGNGATSLKFGNFFTFDSKAGFIDVDIAKVIHFTTSTVNGLSISQLNIAGTLSNLIYGQGRVSLNLGRLLFFEFNLSDALGRTSFDFSAIGKTIVSGFYSQGTFKLDIGRLLDISGSFTPGGVFTLALNGKNFTVDFAAIQSFVAGIPTKIQEVVTQAFANPGQFVVDAAAYLGGLATSIQTSVTGFFAAVPAWTVDASTYLAGLGTALRTSVSGFLANPPAWVINAANYLSGLGTAITTSVTNFFTTPPAWVIDAAGYVGSITTAIQSEINRQLNTPGTFANTAVGTATGVQQGTSQIISDAIINTAAFVDSVKTSITTSLQNAFSLDALFDFQLDARGIASRAGQSIGRFLGNAISGAIDFISLESFSNFGTSFGRFMHSGLLKALAGATVVLGGISNTVADVFLNFFGGIGEGFGGTRAFAKLGAAATAISNAFVTAVENESKALGAKINKPISDFLSSAYNGIVSATQGFADSLIGIANQIIGILNTINPVGQIPTIETFAGQNQRLQSALTSNAARQATDNASTVTPVAPALLSTTPALGSLAQFNQPSTANLQSAINKAAASYDAMSTAALANSKSVSGANAPKYDVLSSAITKTATSLKAPSSTPPSYNPLSSAITSGAGKINAVPAAPSYNPLTGAISGASAKISAQPTPPSYNPLTGAINSASSKLNSMGTPPQFGPLTSAAASAAAKLAGFTVPTIPPFPGWGALVGDVGSPPSNNTGGGGTKPVSTGGGNNAKSVDIGGKGGLQLPQKPIDNQPQKPVAGGFDDTRIVNQLIASTNQIVKALEDNIGRAGANTRKTSVTNLFAVGSGNTVSTADLLNSVLQSDELKNLISAAIKGNVAPAGASNPSSGGDFSASPITWPGRGSIGFGVQSAGQSAFQRVSGAKGQGSAQTQALLSTPPQVTNNYFYNTRNYNLSVQTIQSDASLIEQFGYMERLAASV